jgi:hypothetical protein
MSGGKNSIVKTSETERTTKKCSHKAIQQIKFFKFDCGHHLARFQTSVC